MFELYNTNLYYAFQALRAFAPERYIRISYIYYMIKLTVDMNVKLVNAD